MDKDIFAKLNCFRSHFRINLIDNNPTQAISFNSSILCFHLNKYLFFCCLKFIREVVFDEDNKSYFLNINTFFLFF